MSIAEQVQAKAIISVTATGATALSVASFRPGVPIVMVTANEHVANQLALVYGGKSYVRDMNESTDERLSDWLHKNKILKRGDLVIMTSGKYPGQVGGTDTIRVRRIS
jgi:pyruvate kinase